jgi:glycosyltransferase involved in cell wall biosynthesis
MKRILILTTGSYVFGTEKVILQLLKGLKTEFEFYCLVNGWNDGRFIDQLTKMEIPYSQHKLGWYYISKLFWSIDSLIHLPKALIQFIRIRSNFDLFYTSTFRNIILLYPFINKKVIYHVHEFNSHSRVNRFFIQLTNRKVNKYIAVSKCIKDDLIIMGIMPSKIVVVYNGVDCSNDFENLNNTDSKVRIGIVGQLSRHKGHIELINVFSKIHVKNQNIELKIFGSGSEVFKSEVVNLIEEHYLKEKVILNEYTHDIANIYREIDILCVPTQHAEPFGLVACEAAAFSLPVIASNKGGLTEIIIDNVTGFLINSDNPLEFEEMLNKLIVSETIRRKMGDNARLHIIEKFNERIFIRELKNQINSIS